MYFVFSNFETDFQLLQNVFSQFSNLDIYFPKLGTQVWSVFWGCILWEFGVQRIKCSWGMFFIVGNVGPLFMLCHAPIGLAPSSEDHASVYWHYIVFWKRRFLVFGKRQYLVFGKRRYLVFGKRQYLVFGNRDTFLWGVENTSWLYNCPSFKELYVKYW